MNLVKKTISSSKTYIYLFFVLLHFFLFNINEAEWGDTYRILRASEFIRSGSYPIDEKRPPLFSMLLSLRPGGFEQISWSRGVMFVISILSFIIFDNLTKLIIKKEKYRNICLLLFAINPICLYWSLRVYADSFFTLFVLLVLYLLIRWKDSLNAKKVLIIGVFTGFSILTRFEGYLLFAAVFVGILYSSEAFSLNSKKVFNYLRVNKKNLIVLCLTTFITVLPYLIAMNPLSSKYFSEPQQRTYDFKTVWIYFVSLIYTLGFVYPFYFIFTSLKTVKEFLFSNVSVFVFLVLELILILLWPAAIPRLFMPIIPFLIVIFVLSYESFVESKRTLKANDYVILTSLLGFYVLSQYFLRLQFMILYIPIFLVVIGIQTILLILLFKEKYFAFLYLSAVSSFIWCMSTIWLHKDIYKAIKAASIYVKDNISGVVAFNDTTSTADWYINYADYKPSLSGFFYSMHSGSSISYNKLLEHKVSYLLVTDEDNISVSSKVEKKSYLKLLEEFRYNIGERQFYAKVYEFSGGTK